MHAKYGIWQRSEPAIDACTISTESHRRRRARAWKKCSTTTQPPGPWTSPSTYISRAWWFSEFTTSSRTTYADERREHVGACTSRTRLSLSKHTAVRRGRALRICARERQLEIKCRAFHKIQHPHSGDTVWFFSLLYAPVHCAHDFSTKVVDFLFFIFLFL